MDNQRYELEKELIAVDKRLEKEKTKRNIIMILLCSILCGSVCTAINDSFDSLMDILGLIIGSLFVGGFLYFIAIVAFSFITEMFTDITYLKSRKSALEEKIKTIQNNPTNFKTNDININKKHSIKTDTNFKKLTDKDYKTMLICIDYSIQAFESGLEELSGEEEEKRLEKLQNLNELAEIFQTRRKPDFHQNITALTCLKSCMESISFMLDEDPSIEKDAYLDLLSDIRNVAEKLTP